MPKSKEKFDAAERFWLGPKSAACHRAYRMQSTSTQQKWFATTDGLELDPDYSEFSIRIWNPKARTLSWVYKTLAILPKSRLREIYNLIGAYLDEKDSKDTG